MSQKYIDEALAILQELDFPRAQLNERSALTLLALLDLRPGAAWSSARDPLMGITPIMDWAREHYGKEYAPNTRETFRRQTMHQFVDAGMVRYNPDKPDRPVNSPAAVYQISPEALALIRTRGGKAWIKGLQTYQGNQKGLAAHYAKDRDMAQIPVDIPGGGKLVLSPGAHSELIKAIIEDFGPRFVPGARLIYAGDTGQKVGCFDESALARFGVVVDKHGKMPDVVLYDSKRNWLILIESVTSHGPVDGKRHDELAKLFSKATPGLVYVTAFPNRQFMAKYLPVIAWETEVWNADAPSHLIHFNGVRFLGPYDKA